MRRLLPWALPAALLLEPIRSTLTYGQINALLMALVTFDCLTRTPRWPRGILVGIAAAVKLTPGVFLLFFLLRRDLRSAARAGLSFAAAPVPGSPSPRTLAPLLDPDRLSARADRRTVLRLQPVHTRNPGPPRPSPPARAWLWLALCLLVAALAVTGMRGALRTGQVTHALVLNAAAGLLISPISWSHHWVWAAPALLTCLATTNPNQRRRRRSRS